MEVVPRWHNNSCYIDSLLYVLHSVYPDILVRIKKGADERVARKLFEAYKKADVKGLRKLFKKVDPETDWLYGQQEPIEALFLLERFFVFPETVYTCEVIYGAKKAGSSRNLVNISLEKNSFVSLIVEADKDQRLSLSSTSVDKVDGWDEGYEYRIVKRRSIVQGLVMVHVDRNAFGKKSRHNVVAPATLQGCCALRGVIVHLGNAPDHGHYVAYVRRGKGWLFYDDMVGVKQVDGLPDSVWGNCTDFIYC